MTFSETKSKSQNQNMSTPKKVETPKPAAPPPAPVVSTRDPIIETKKVKHVFTDGERLALIDDLLNARDARASLEEDFDSTKKSYNSRIAEKQSQEGAVAMTLRAGFELRPKECRVEYFPKLGKKRYWLKDAPADAPFVIEENMIEGDYQAELLHSESEFDSHDEIPMFVPSATDYGKLIIGRYRSLWYHALRIKVGKHAIDDRLNPEGKGCKVRFDAVAAAKKAALDWFKANLKDAAKGFEDGINKVCDAHKERVE